MDLNKIRLVEIELHSYCNRTCAFCPNSYIDRSFYKELPKKTFIKLIDELKENDYSNYITFSRYNEPFFNREVLEERIRQVRKRLPKVTLVANTNGDYDYKGIDLDELTVMDYDHKLKPNNDKKVRIARLGEITNRGEALKFKKPIRDFPCFEPSYFVGIDYEGSVMPCCELRHDVPKHKSYILGNIKDNSLTEILNSYKAKKFRAEVSNSQFSGACKTCTKTPGRYTADKSGINKEVLHLR
jgi:radical SAM protein with 4Fe4S-binding SPASM domain